MEFKISALTGTAGALARTGEEYKHFSTRCLLRNRRALTIQLNLTHYGYPAMRQTSCVLRISSEVNTPSSNFEQ